MARKNKPNVEAVWQENYANICMITVHVMDYLLTIFSLKF